MAVDLRNEKKEGVRDESDEPNLEEDQLIPYADANSRPGDDDTAKHEESADADVGIGIARGESSEPAGADDDLEYAAEGRFKGMRSRIKKAGQGLMNKSPTFRRTSAEDKLRLGGERSTITEDRPKGCLLYTSPSPRDKRQSRMPSSA